MVPTTDPGFLNHLCLFSLLITSHHNDRIDILEDQQMHHLEIYVSCLAILSDFEDYEGSFWLMREDAKQHPKLDSDPKEQSLRNKMVELARNPRYHSNLRSASAKVLNNYGLDSQGRTYFEQCTLVQNPNTVASRTSTPSQVQ